MGVWRALIQGFSLTRRLWVAMGLFLVVYAGVGALATVLLPYQVVEGRVQVPTPADMSQALKHLGIGLILYALGLGLSLYLLAGVFGGLRRQIREESFSGADLFALSRSGSLPMLGWGVGFFLVEFAASAAVAVAAWLLSAVTGLGQAGLSKALMQMGFYATSLLVGLLLLFSPVILVERACRAWASFRESARFVRDHVAGTLGIVFGVSLIGAVVWALWLIVAQAVRQVQAALGIPPFSPGLPVFVFGWVLVAPQAFLTVYLPAVLYAYYHRKTST